MSNEDAACDACDVREKCGDLCRRVGQRHSIFLACHAISITRINTADHAGAIIHFVAKWN